MKKSRTQRDFFIHNKDGTFFVVYEGYNDLSKYGFSDFPAGGSFSFPGGAGYDKIDNQYCCSSHLLLYNKEVVYRFSENTLLL